MSTLTGKLRNMGLPVANEAADALDAQDERIKALEGALRKVVEEWDNDYCVDYADVIEDTRALLGEK